jgi:hypothetical protein
MDKSSFSSRTRNAQGHALKRMILNGIGYDKVEHAFRLAKHAIAVQLERAAVT